MGTRFLGYLPRSGGGDLEEKEAKQGCNVKQEVTGRSGSVSRKLGTRGVYTPHTELLVRAVCGG